MVGSRAYLGPIPLVASRQLLVADSSSGGGGKNDLTRSSRAGNAFAVSSSYGGASPGGGSAPVNGASMLGANFGWNYGILGSGPVNLADGNVLEPIVDAEIPTTAGIPWRHYRTYSAFDTDTNTDEGWNWRSQYWALLEEDTPSTDDVTITLDQYTKLEFEWDAIDESWGAPASGRFFLDYDDTNDEYVLTTGAGYQLVFHSYDAAVDADIRGRIKNLYDNYDRGLTFTRHTSGTHAGNVDYVDDADNHRARYTYNSTSGKLEKIEMHKTDTEPEVNADLIGRIEFTYNDGTDPGGTSDDLMRVRVSLRATSDADGTLSIVRNTHYRYFTDDSCTGPNPGAQHKLKMILRPENYDRAEVALSGDPLTKTDAQVDDYANVQFEYDCTDYRVAQTIERGSSCSSCGSSSSVGTFAYTWTLVDATPDDFDTVMMHVAIDLPEGESGTDLYIDTNETGEVINWVRVDGGSQWRYHYDYGTADEKDGRLIKAYGPDTVTAYNDSSQVATLSASAGLVYVYGYSTAEATNGLLNKVSTRMGETSGSETAERYFFYTSNSEYSATLTAEGPSSTSGSASNYQYSYTFHDDGAGEVKTQINEVAIDSPTVTTAQNGPNVRSTYKAWYDDRGLLRWTEDGEGNVDYYGYDDGVGVSKDKSGPIDLYVIDADTATLLTSIDDDWDGTLYFTLDDDTPYTGNTTSALDIETVAEYDFLGRIRKLTEPDGANSYRAYNLDDIREYRKWDGTSLKPLLPTRIWLTDKEGRIEEYKELETDTHIATSSSKPTGTDSLGNGDLTVWYKGTYNDSGQLTDTKEYHNIPASGAGSAYSNYYQMDYEYDAVGNLQYMIEQVADTSDYDTEQVTEFEHDRLNRVITIKRAVSDETHDITSSKPTMNTVEKRYYDDPDAAVSSGTRDSTKSQGHGPGLLSWVETFYSASNSTAIRYGYDDRERQTLVLPDATTPNVTPYTVTLYDELDRPTAVGTYKSLTGMTESTDPTTDNDSDRLSLEKTAYDNDGRIYQTIVYADPTADPQLEPLTTEIFYDRNDRLVATDPPDMGILFTMYDGAGRVSEHFTGTKFDTAKYTNGAFDHPDSDEGIVERRVYTYDEVGRIELTTHHELNSDDTDGMELVEIDDDYIRSYVANWYDSAGQLTEKANYGTNDSNNKWKDASLTRPSTAPTRSDSVLVTSFTYDKAGRLEKVTDPAAKDKLTVYDDMGRVSYEDLADGSATAELRLEYQYDGLSNQVRYIADPDADNELLNGVWSKDTAGSDEDQFTEYVYGDPVDASWVTEVRYPTGDGTVGSTDADKEKIAYHFDGTVDTFQDQNITIHTYIYDALRRLEADKITTLGGPTDGAVRARKWVYNNAGLIEKTTTYSDAAMTTVVNEVKNDYSAFVRGVGSNPVGYPSKVEFDFDSVVGNDTALNTQEVLYSYDTDFEVATDIEQFYRRESIKYPDGRYIWNGYSKDSTTSHQDEINHAFSRLAQIREGTSSAAGDFLVEYDYNGLGRLVQRTSTSNATDTDWNGNDTHMDLWGPAETSGEYAGFDRFGRIVDLRVQETVGDTDLLRRQYAYDRANNRTKIADPFWKLTGAKYAHDDRHRLTDEDRGWLNSSNTLELNTLLRDFGMTDVGATTNDKINDTSINISHTVNATNEITTLDAPKPSGPDLEVTDDFASALSAAWSAVKGTFSATGGVLNAATLHGTDNIAVLEFDADTGDSSYQVKVKVPIGAGNKKAGVFLGYNGTTGYAAVINAASDRLSIVRLNNSGGALSFGVDLAYTSVTINEDEEYTITVVKRQRIIEAWLQTNPSTRVSYSHANINFFGSFGVATTVANTDFDDLKVWDGFPREQHGRRWRSSAATSLDTTGGILLVNGKHHGGEVVFTGHGDDEYMAQVDINLNSGADAALYFRYLDPDNWYRALIRANGAVKLEKMLWGKKTTLGSGTYTPSTWTLVKIIYDVGASQIKVNVAGTDVITSSDSDIPWGYVALSGWQAQFQDLKVGYDTNGDDVIEDVVIGDLFDGTSVSPTYDDNGNLTKDADYAYTYDAWNNLVKVVAQNVSTAVVASYAYFGDNRRASSTVTNRGDLDATTYFLYDGFRVIQEWDGSELGFSTSASTSAAYVYGPNYIDEPVMTMGSDGTYFMYQDANANVIGLTTPGGDLAEEYNYTPYGRMVAKRHHAFGDADADGDVDATDNTAWLATQGGGGVYDRNFDADYDGDNDSFDGTAFNANYLAAGSSIEISGRSWSPNGNPYTYTARRLDAESMLMHYRLRTYSPAFKSFLQRDPLRYHDSSNLYQYVGGYPLGFMDPYGLSFWSKAAQGFIWLTGGNKSWLDGTLPGDLSDGAAATIDGYIPIFDPFEDWLDHPYGDNPVTKWSYRGGQFARTCITTANLLKYGPGIWKDLRPPNPPPYKPDFPWPNMAPNHPLGPGTLIY